MVGSWSVALQVFGYLGDAYEPNFKCKGTNSL